MTKVFVTLMLVIWVLIAQPTRIKVVGWMVNIYESATGKTAAIVPTPFTDVSDADKNTVAKAYGLGITAGTSETTFSPNDKTEPYQAFLFAGRTIQAINNFNIHNPMK